MCPQDEEDYTDTPDPPAARNAASTAHWMPSRARTLHVKGERLERGAEAAHSSHGPKAGQGASHCLRRRGNRAIRHKTHTPICRRASPDCQPRDVLHKSIYGAARAAHRVVRHLQWSGCHRAGASQPPAASQPPVSQPFFPPPPSHCILHGMYVLCGHHGGHMSQPLRPLWTLGYWPTCWVARQQLRQ